MAEPRRYCKRPVVIEAMQVLSDDDLNDARSWVGGDASIVLDDESDTTMLLIPTLEGDMKASWERGDWVIKGVQGEFYPCKPDIFAATYEQAS